MVADEDAVEGLRIVADIFGYAFKKITVGLRITDLLSVFVLFQIYFLDTVFRQGG